MPINSSCCCCGSLGLACPWSFGVAMESIGRDLWGPRICVSVKLGRKNTFFFFLCCGRGPPYKYQSLFLCEMLIYRYISLRALKWFKPEVSIFIGSQVTSQNHMSEKSKFSQVCGHQRVFEVFTKGISWSVSYVKAHKIIK